MGSVTLYIFEYDDQYIKSWNTEEGLIFSGDASTREEAMRVFLSLSKEVTMNELGKIKILDPREQWKNEEYDFTPWLEENIDYLSEAIGIEIEIEAIEKRVGSYELDMFGYIAGTDKKVVIENQLESSDHKHLGQLLTYASGLDASVSIWITPYINDEHKQAIEWLNTISMDDKSFFLIRPELIRIDDSKPAVRFYLEAGPSEFGRGLRAAIDKNNPRHQLRRQFWQGLLDHIRGHNRPWAKNRNTTADSWMNFSTGYKNISVGVSMAMHSRLRVEIGFAGGDQETNKENYCRYENNQECFNKHFDSDVSFELLEDKIMSRIAVYKEYDKSRLLEDKDYTRSLYAWYEEALRKMYAIVDEIR